MIVLGIDIGGSGIKAAEVNSRTGEMVSERFRLPTPKPATPEAVAKTVCKIIKHFKWKGPVGVSFPTVVKGGKALLSSNLDDEWKKTKIDKLFKKRCGQDFYVVNDADAAAIAEMNYGAGKGHKGLVITVTIGTGIGSGVYFDGKLLRNFELGRIFWKDGDIIEKYAADSARKREDLSLKQWAKRFDKFLNHVEWTMHPDLFILGGGISKKFDDFKRHLTANTKLVAAENLNNAGIIGAALFAYEHVS
ncbi:MAG: ROK family protein [Flavobacteriaceae bacterium]|nr:ROK family protein [Bacteroidia bacterium]NNK87082.1 ROK family protein [Flavobacteriaceae bacterium]